jgi:hypothetical protein
LPPANDDCANATTIATGQQPDLDTRGATTAGSDPFQSCTIGGSAKNSKSVWFRYTPATAGSVIVNTVSSTYDTVLTAYTGTCGAVAAVACDDDGAINGASRVQFTVTGGTSYLIEVTAKGAGGAGGTLRLLLAQFSSSPVPTPTAQATPPAPPGDPKLVDACQKAVKKAGAKLVSTTLKSLASCSNRLVKCIQTKADPAQRDACTLGAGEKCGKDLAKADAARATFNGSVLKRCGLLGIGDLRGAAGLGFDAVAGECAGPADSIGGITACIGEQHRCQAAKLYELAQPRARELMHVAGIGAGSFPLLTCLTDYNGGGQDLDQEATNGKLLEKCSKAIAKTAGVYVNKKLKSLEKCVDKLFTCAVVKAGDAACGTKANAVCTSAFGAIINAESTLRAALQKSCGALDYTGVLAPAVGANLGVLASECASFGVAAPDTFPLYVNCLARQHGCRTEDLLRFQSPRASELLAGTSPPITFPSTQCP